MQTGNRCMAELLQNRYETFGFLLHLYRKNITIIILWIN